VTPRKWTGRPRGRPKLPDASKVTRELLTLRLRPDQRAALERIAEAERARRGGVRLDLSRLVREAIDAWLAARRGR
jgi:hypothetical protein